MFNSPPPQTYIRIFRPWENDSRVHPPKSQQETTVNNSEIFAHNKDMSALPPSTVKEKKENVTSSDHESDVDSASCSSSCSKSSSHEKNFYNGQLMENSSIISHQVSPVRQVPVVQQVPQVPVSEQQMPQYYGSIENQVPYYTAHLQRTAYAAHRNYLVPTIQPADAVNSLPPVPINNSRALVANTSNPYALNLIQHENMRELAKNFHVKADKPRKKRPKNFFCTECTASFSNKGQLTNHIRTHTGERPFKCDLCKKAFTRNEELTRHKRIHSGHKPFPCPICGKFFGRQDHRKKHTKTHFPQEIRTYYVPFYQFIHQF